MNRFLSVAFFCLLLTVANAQSDRWQQKVKYNIDVKMDVTTNRITGIENVDYWNNSPDTLERLFIHLYWNAFQPNSMMDVRSRELGKILIGYDRTGTAVYDWDERVKDRISKLTPEEIGYDSVQYLKINNAEQKLIYHETILEVQLDKPLLPHSKTTMNIAFKAQVPLQIRRSGRDNAEGVRYSMSQWYPKIVEYDYQGWNPNPYVAREFYGVWGDYDVNITIDKSYLVAGSGTLQNANEIGFGYAEKTANNTKFPAGKYVWKFSAQNVHDFVWAADTAYTIIKRQPKNGPLLYIVHKKVDSLENKWQKVADTVELAYPFIAKTFGAYPYKNYSFIQGGDGGMEYPMATLIKTASVGTAIHEWMHSWYQGMMANNESLYAWMDEGFTSYAEARVIQHVRHDTGFAYKGAYSAYFRLVNSGKEEPLSTHADRFNTNYASASAAYNKGAVFMAQLGYIVGEDVLDKILLAYYNEWRFKHPNPNDFIRVAEKVSGMELQWYKEYWIYSTKTIDYALGDFNMVDNKTSITLKNHGTVPMPIDVLITYKDGTQEMHYVPMYLMFGGKQQQDKNIPFIVHEEWRWTHPEYTFQIDHNIKDIKKVQIDPSLLMADVNRQNNKITIP